MDDIVQTIDSSKKEVKALVEKAQNNQLECQPGRTMIESFENNVNQALNAGSPEPEPERLTLTRNPNPNVKQVLNTGSP